MSLSNPCGVLEPFVVEANEIFQASLSTNTWNSYETGMSALNKFRKNYNLHVDWPSTAKIYVSALSFSLKCKGFQDTTQHFIVKQMLKGMSKLHGTSDMRLPITIQMIKQFPTALVHVCSSRYEAIMFMSAFALAFSALLRVGEFACTSSNESEKIIQNNDINFDNDKTLSLRLRYSKTDQYEKSCVLKIDDNILQFSTYSALKAYLNIRPKFNGPLFCHLNRSVLTRTQFLSALQSSLQFRGFNTHRINTHSFRIGATTYYAMLGLNEDEIKIKKGQMELQLILMLY